MTDHTSAENDYREHERTYHGFVHGAAALTLGTIFILVALATFAFGKTLAVPVGMIGMFAGFAAILFDLRSGGKSWGASFAVLVLFGLISAFLAS